MNNADQCNRELNVSRIIRFSVQKVRDLSEFYCICLFCDFRFYVQRKMNDPKFKEHQLKLERTDELREKQKELVKMAVVRFYSSK